MKKNSISIYLSMIERDHNYFMNKELRKFNLGKHDARVLREIESLNGISQNEICSNLKEDKMTVSKSVKRLVAQGYIKKSVDASDKRITNLIMTEEGIAVKKEILEILTRVNSIFLRNFETEDQEQVINILKNLFMNISSEVTRLKDN